MGAISATVSAKLLLSGEHGVLLGAPAVGIPFPLRLRATLTPALSFYMRLSKENEEALSPYPTFTRALREMLDIYGAGNSCITIESAIPLSSGLGSSAALSVACAKIVHALHRGRRLTQMTRVTPADTEAIWERAHALECHFHHTPSGVDTGIIAAGAPLLFFHRADMPRHRAGKQESVLAMRAPHVHYRCVRMLRFRASCMILVLPRHTTAQQMIATIRTHAHARAPHAPLHAFCQRSAEFAQILRDNEAKPDANACARGYHVLRQIYALQKTLGISTPEIDAFITHARECGSVAAKVSGAGGGGSAFALFPNRRTLTRASVAVRRFCLANYPQYQLYGGELVRGRWRAFMHIGGTP